MTAPCPAAWKDHVLPFAHHCGLDEGHEGLHVCAACTQLPAGRVDAGNRVGGDDAARPELLRIIGDVDAASVDLPPLERDAEVADAILDAGFVPRQCQSRHRPGIRHVPAELVVGCDRRAGHRGWHKAGVFEWDDEHAEPESGGSES